jgi:hypothetical protein
MSSPLGIFFLGWLVSIMRTIRGARLVGHKPLSEMKLGKPRGKSGETPPQKNPAEAGLVGRLGSPAPETGHAGVLI